MGDRPSSIVHRRSAGQAVELKAWKRREHYELFRKYRQPFFNLTVEVDVTTLWDRSRSRAGPSFFLASLYLMLKAVNDTEAFRLRLRKRGVWRHDRVAVGPTILRSDNTFAFVRLEAGGSLDDFVRTGTRAIESAASRTTLAPMTRTDDIVFHSVLPWCRFTSFANALSGDDSIPRIVFGRCTTEGPTTTMPVAVEVHHALVDGLDVSRFLDRFAAHLREVS